MKINFNNILCATDLSDLSSIAISSGVALAKAFDAKLFVCHIVDLSTTAAYGDIIFAPLELQNKTIGYTHEQLEQIMQNQTLNWEPLVTAGHPPDEISKFVAMHQIDLVVSATHGRSGLKRVFLGSVTERLMRVLPCPLLIVRSLEDVSAPVGGPSLRFKKILVGCDFSSFSALAFQYGLSLAQDFEAELHLVHVIERPLYKDILKSGASPGVSSEKKLHDQLSEKLSKMIPKESVAWCRPKTTLLAGRPYEEIIKYALLNSIDLIVLGIRGRNLIEVLLTGSTTDRVSRQGPCPVLSVCPIAVKKQET
jgi:nucleotide-binding universal stress UspA family protein